VLIDISSATLRKMVKLSERKEALLSQIQELDRQMAALQQPAEEGGGFIRLQPLKRPSATRAAKSRMERGALKAKIIAALRAAGRGGMTIRELSDKLGIKPANLYVWFNGTGRKTKGIKKIGPAKYRL
jgi:DNA-binding transcriptional MerR regulator